MQTISDTRLRRGPVHILVERATADREIRISCAGPQCAAWDPMPCESLREALFWYDRHVLQPLIRQLW